MSVWGSRFSEASFLLSPGGYVSVYYPSCSKLWSMVSAASFCMGGVTCPYRLRVIAMSECPNISLTTFGLMP
jgi:hypothetical protein